MEQANQTIEATWGIALKIWWWMIWRSSLAIFIIVFIVSSIVGIILLGVAKIDFATTQIIVYLLALVLGLAINIFFFKKIIGRKFKDFSLVLSKTE